MTCWGILRVGKERPDARPRPASIVLVGPPGSGKTELLLRFQGNRPMQFRSDLTVRGLWKALTQAEKGRITHIVMTEFNKLFQRKLATAVNCLGTFVEAMDEGVFESEVGPMHWSFKGARLGLIGGMTGTSLKKRRGMLYEMGFLDRCAMLPWELPDDQRRDILDRITHGNRDDMARVMLPHPDRPTIVQLPPPVGERIAAYTWKGWPDESLRMITRFRALAMAAALLDGRDVVKEMDLERSIFQFDDYWQRLVLTNRGPVYGLNDQGDDE